MYIEYAAEASGIWSPNYTPSVGWLLLYNGITKWQNADDDDVVE